MGLVEFSASLQPILVDASFLISVYDRRAHDHKRCMEALERVDRPLVTCEPVITETIYRFRQVSGAPQAILASIKEGQLELAFRLADSASQVASHYTKYADTPCDFADACLIAMADELDTGDILTLDSDFKHYRWRRNRRFNLLIPLD
jgi:predicted nucleic acid-binding protein